MGNVKLRHYNNSEYITVQSPEGQIYNIYNELVYLDLRAQIILYKEQGWKVIESTNPELYKPGEISIDDGYIEGKVTISDYPFQLHSNLCKAILDIRNNRLTLRDYFNKTNTYFNYLIK